MGALLQTVCFLGHVYTTTQGDGQVLRTSADGLCYTEGTNYQPAKRRKTATSQALSAAHMIQNSAPCPPVTQKSVVQPMQRPGRSSLAFEQPIQDSDDDEDESLTSLEDNPKDEANTSTNASEEGSGSFEGFEVVRRASEETESSTVSCFEDEQHIFGIV